MNKKKALSIINSRHLKILSVKKEFLKNSIVLVCIDENKITEIEKSKLQSLISKIDEIEPSGIYFPIFKKMKIDFYDMDEFRNKNILITVHHGEKNIDMAIVEQKIRDAIPVANSIKFIHDITIDTDR